MKVITDQRLKQIKPESKPYFLRDTKLKGFGVKMNTSGTIKFIAETWHQGKSYRKTIGEFPYINTQIARERAHLYLAQIKSGQYRNDNNIKRELSALLISYLSGGRLKSGTCRDYKNTVHCYLHDWLTKPVSSITKDMVENRFYQIRDKGINGGRPTYSQATKTMRILSALMNYAMADDLIDSNPVDVLKQKRVDRSIRKRDVYLPVDKARELLFKTASDAHPATLAVHLMLHTGLRKNEALRLKWEDLGDTEGIPCLTIGDTKNKRPHYVPITGQIQKILDKAQNGSVWVFPSTQRLDSCIKDVRRTLRRLTKLIEFEFKCHDLRRTFATRASEVGIDYLMVKRMLNHRSNDITAQYIQWHSRQNLEVMREALEKIQY